MKVYTKPVMKKVINYISEPIFMDSGSIYFQGECYYCAFKLFQGAQDGKYDVRIHGDMKHSADHTNTGQDWYFYLCTSMPEGVTVTFNGVTCDLIADPDDGSERSVAVAYGVTAWPWQNTTDNIGLSDIIFHVDWPGASAAEINALLNGNTLVGDISISDTAYRPTPTP